MDDIQGTKHLQTFRKAHTWHPLTCHRPWTSAMAKVTNCCVLFLPTHPRQTPRHKRRLLSCLPKGMGPRSRKAAGLQPSCLCLPQGKETHRPGKDTRASWKHGRRSSLQPILAKVPFDFHPPRSLRSRSGVAWHGTAQGGLSAFGSFPTGRGNLRPSPAGSLVIAGKTGEERASRTVPVSRAQVPG